MREGSWIIIAIAVVFVLFVTIAILVDVWKGYRGR